MIHQTPGERVQNAAGSGQREAPRLVLEVGGTSALQAVMPGKLKSTLLETLK